MKYIHVHVWSHLCWKEKTKNCYNFGCQNWIAKCHPNAKKKKHPLEGKTIHEAARMGLNYQVLLDDLDVPMRI